MKKVFSSPWNNRWRWRRLCQLECRFVYLITLKNVAFSHLEKPSSRVEWQQKIPKVTIPSSDYIMFQNWAAVLLTFPFFCSSGSGEGWNLWFQRSLHPRIPVSRGGHEEEGDEHPPQRVQPILWRALQVPRQPRRDQGEGLDATGRSLATHFLPLKRT